MVRHHKVTLSLSQDIIQQMHLLLPKRGISRFVEEAVRDKLEAKKMSLEEQYKEAAKDADRNQIFAEWEHLSGEGLDEENDW